MLCNSHNYYHWQSVKPGQKLTTSKREVKPSANDSVKCGARYCMTEVASELDNHVMHTLRHVIVMGVLIVIFVTDSSWLTA